VRKKDILPLINLAKPKLKAFISAFNQSEQTPKTKEVFAANIQNLKNNYKIVKLNRKLDVTLKRNSPNREVLTAMCEKYEITSINLNILL
jgi:hypothetical protein